MRSPSVPRASLRGNKSFPFPEGDGDEICAERLRTNRSPSPKGTGTRFVTPSSHLRCARGTEGECNRSPKGTGRHSPSVLHVRAQFPEGDAHDRFVSLTFFVHVRATEGDVLRSSSVPRASLRGTVARTCTTEGVVFAHLLPHKSSICEKGTCCAYAHGLDLCGTNETSKKISSETTRRFCKPYNSKRTQLSRKTSLIKK